MKRSTSPLPEHSHLPQYEPTSHRPPTQPLLLNPEWRMSESTSLAYPLENAYPQQYPEAYTIPYQTSPTTFMPTQPQMNHGLNIEGSYVPLGSHMDGMSFDWQDFQNDLMAYPTANGLPDMNIAQQNLPENSPTDTYLEVRSLTSSGSENGWATIDYPQQPLSQDPQQPAGAIFNPGQTLHGRTFSDSSYSDLEQQSRHSWSSGYVEVPNAISSPGTDSLGDADLYHDQRHSNDHCQHDDNGEGRPKRPNVVTTSASKPISIKKPSSPQRSPTSSGRSSPPTRQKSRKTTNAKSLKSVARKPAQVPKIDTEKRIGRRKGPLSLEQRKQAGEIRKLGACLRCKFLKKTVGRTLSFICVALTISSVIRESHARDVSLRMRACGLYLARELT